MKVNSLLKRLPASVAFILVSFGGYKSLSGTNTNAGLDLPSPSGITFESLLAMKAAGTQHMPLKIEPSPVWRIAKK